MSVDQSLRHEAAGQTGTFWQDGFVEPAPLFPDQLAGLAHAPRPNLIRAEPRYKGHVPVPFTEGEGMRDLEDYMTYADEQLVHSRSIAAQQCREFLATMRSRFSFMGTPEYATASAGVSRAWSDHLRKNKNAMINVVDPRIGFDGEPELSHSYIKVTHDVVAGVDEDVRDRVLTDPWQWRRGRRWNNLFVALDDWTISGAVAKDRARAARYQAGRFKPGLMRHFELHLLAAPADRLGPQNIGAYALMAGEPQLRLRAQVRSHYRMPPARPSALNSYGNFISGAHSVVDFGYLDALRQISCVIEPHLSAERRRMPLLTNLRRAY